MFHITQSGIQTQEMVISDAILQRLGTFNKKSCLASETMPSTSTVSLMEALITQ